MGDLIKILYIRISYALLVCLGCIDRCYYQDIDDKPVVDFLTQVDFTIKVNTLCAYI